jgi:hypothetical protein
MSSNHSRIDGVNLLLAEILIPRVSALDSSGSWPSKTYCSSPEGQAEYYLDLFTRQVCNEGLDTRCDRNQSFNTGGGTIHLGGRVVKVAGKAGIENRQLSVRPIGGNMHLYDNEAGSDTFAAGTYVVDVWREAPFEELSGSEQALVLAFAVDRFVRIMAPDIARQRDNDRIRAEMMNMPVTPRTAARARREPMIPQQPQQ